MGKPNSSAPTYTNKTLDNARSASYVGKQVNTTEKKRWGDLRTGQFKKNEITVRYDESIKTTKRTKRCRKCHNSFTPAKSYYKFCSSCSKY